MKVLLTGGSGFIGRCIVEQLGRRLRDPGSLARGARADRRRIGRGVAAPAPGRRRHPRRRPPGHRNAADPSRQLEINLRMFANLCAVAMHWGACLPELRRRLRHAGGRDARAEERRGRGACPTTSTASRGT